jgi:hypothetical protein
MAAGATGAHAQSPGSVVMVRVGGDEEIATRLRGELRRADWKVIELTPRRDQQGRALQDLASGWSAEAAIRARPRSFDVELWVHGRGDDDPGSLELVNAGRSNDAGLLAVRVTEAMRARGLAVQTPSATGAGAVASGSPPSGGASVLTPTPEGLTHGASATPANAGAPGAPRNADATRNGQAPGPTRNPDALVAPRTTTPSGSATNPRPPEPPAPVPPARNTSAAPARTDPKPANPQARNETKPQTAPARTEAETAIDSPPPEPEAESSSAAGGGGHDRFLVLELAPALIWSAGQPGRLGPGGDALLNVSVRPLAYFAFSAFVLGPIVPARLERSEGSAAMRSLITGVGVDLLLDLGRWELQGGVAAASVISWFSATPNDTSGLVARDVVQRTAAMLLRAATLLRLNDLFRLSLRVWIGFGVPELRLSFSQEPVASWGRPLVGGSLGLELALF